MTVALILFLVLLAVNLLLWVALAVSAIRWNAQHRRDVDAELARRKSAPTYAMVEGP